MSIRGRLVRWERPAGVSFTPSQRGRKPLQSEHCVRGVDLPCGMRCKLIEDFSAEGSEVRSDGVYSFRARISPDVRVVLSRRRQVDPRLLQETRYCNGI